MLRKYIPPEGESRSRWWPSNVPIIERNELYAYTGISLTDEYTLNKHDYYNLNFTQPYPYDIDSPYCSGAEGIIGWRGILEPNPTRSNLFISRSEAGILIFESHRQPFPSIFPEADNRRPVIHKRSFHNKDGALVTSNPTGLVHIPHGHILPNGIYVTSPKFQFLVRDEFGLLTPIYNIGVQEDEKRQSYVLLIRKAQNLSPEIVPAIEKLLEVPKLEFKDVLLGYAKRLMLTYEFWRKTS